MLSRDEIQVPPGVCQHSTSTCRSLTFLQATNLPSYALNVSYRTALNYMQRDAYAILVSVSPPQLVSYVCPDDLLERLIFYCRLAYFSLLETSKCGLPVS